mmetsp:Transcript_30587/g.70005  ORF Transcript_30587/g.70005 Transcript_30587/m.70005 type:complete len:82 (+) Transcript_30587:1069-1314(+)
MPICLFGIRVILFASHICFRTFSKKSSACASNPPPSVDTAALSNRAKAMDGRSPLPDLHHDPSSDTNRAPGCCHMHHCNGP